MFRSRQKRKRAGKVKKRRGYDRSKEAKMVIGEEFLNPTKEMDKAASEIQKHFRKK